MDVKEAKAVCRALAKKYFRVSPSQMMAEEMIAAGIDSVKMAQQVLGNSDDWSEVISHISTYASIGKFASDHRYERGHYEVAR